MKLYWSPRSPFVRKTLVAIHELGLADTVDIVPTVVKMDEANATMLAANPLGKIPALVLDDGAVLFDSFVIIDHLDQRQGGKLIPATGAARVWTLKHHALANGLLDILVLWRNERDKAPLQQSTGWIENFGVKTRHVLDAFERLVPELEAHPVGLAQITVGVALSYLDFRFADLSWREGRPALAAWHAMFRQRPAMQATEIGA